MKEIIHDFLKATTGPNLSDSPQEMKLPQPPLELPLPPGAQLIALPAPKGLDIPEIGLRKAVERRRSIRRYSAQPLTLAELSYLLWMTQGVKDVTARPATLRTVPSAGARHAFETYLLVNHVEGLEPGVYRFAAGRHALVCLDFPGDIRERIHLACCEQAQVYNSAVTFLWVAVLERMTWGYVERGLRYLYLDAGHVCQNLYLAAEAIDCGVCAVAAYDDEALNAALEIDGENLFTIYIGTVGKKKIEGT